MKPKKRMSNKAFAGIWGTVLAILLVAVLVGNYFAMKYTTIITRSLGHTTSKVVTTGDGTGDSEYYKSDYSSHEELVEHQTEFSQQPIGEAVVLMKNEDNVLPLETGKKISLFGIGTAKFQYGGSGSGAIELGWVNYFPNIKGCMWVGYAGQEGISSIPKTITGEINPSGRLVDTYAVDADTGVEITNQFDSGNFTYYDSSYVYLSRNDWVGTWPVFYGEADEKGKYTAEATEEFIQDSQYDIYEEDPDAEMPTTDSGENVNLITMRGKDYDDEGWDAVLDCLTVDEMVEMVRLGGWQTMAIDSISKPMSSDQDGPAGLSGELIMSDVDCMGYPNQETLAATWNTELSLEFGKCIGEDGLAAGLQAGTDLWLIAFDIVMGVLIVGGALLVIRRCKKNR